MIKLDYRNSKPIYEQIKEEMKKLIIKGAVKSDEKIPSVRELAFELSINPNTIQRAYRELEMEGYIYSARGKGFFVASIDDEITKDKKEKLKKELVKIGKELKYLHEDKEVILKLLEDVFK